MYETLVVRCVTIGSKGKPADSRKNALSYYELAHVANCGWLIEQDQTLVHFGDHLTLTIT